MLFKTQIFVSLTAAATVTSNVNFLQCSMLIPGDHSVESDFEVKDEM